MKTKSWADIQRAKGKTDEQIEAGRRHARAELLEMDLAALREQAGLTQTEVAAAAGMTQPSISQLEAQEGGRIMIDTLRKYMHAIGGELEVVAVLGNKRVTLPV
jgi:predicted XRE-type DNA-binding protein